MNVRCKKDVCGKATACNLSLVINALKIFGIILILFLLTTTVQAGDWPMFRHDPAHTGQADGDAEPALELLWKYKTGGAVYSSPAVSNGVVYVGSYDKYVYALDADTGAVKWKYKTDSWIWSSPAVSNGMVYVGSRGGYVYALDANTGAMKWKYKRGDSVYSSPAVSNGVVYIGTRICGDHSGANKTVSNYMYALDADTGTVKWKYTTHFYAKSSPAVSNGVVYIGSDLGNNMYALDADTGAVKWKCKTGGDVDSSPAISNGVVYVGSKDDYVYALDADTGAVKWKCKTGGDVDSSPAISNGVVYVGSKDDYVYALDANTGAVKWKCKTPFYVMSSPAVAGGVVYVGSGMYIYALDAETGAVKWKYKTGDSVYSSPAVSNGVVYVGSTDNYVYAFVAKSKRVKSTITKVQSAIESANKIGADTTEARNLLDRAETALSNEHYQEAINYANQAKISAVLAISQIEAQSTITKAQSAIESANKIGADTTEAQNLLNRAETALSDEQYQDAINYANQAKTSAEQLLEALKNYTTRVINNAQSAIDSAKSNGADTTEAERLLQQAKTALNKGEYKDAKKYANQAKKKAEMAIMAHNVLTVTVIAVVIFVVVSVARILRKR